MCMYIYIYDDEEKLNRESARRRNRNGSVPDIDPVGMRGQPLSYRIVEMFLNRMTLRFIYFFFFLLFPLDYFPQCC